MQPLISFVCDSTEAIGRSEKVQNIQKSRVSVEDHVARARQKRRARLCSRSLVPRFHRSLFSKSFDVRGASHHRLPRFKRTCESNRSRCAVNLRPSTSNVSFLLLPTFFCLFPPLLSLSLSLVLFLSSVELLLSSFGCLTSSRELRLCFGTFP